jgi:hypothetical protein
VPRPHIEPWCDSGTGYRRFSLRGFPRGSHYKLLSLDPGTGACSLKQRFDAGYRRPAGWSYSDMELFILRGEARVGGERVGEGQYYFVPAGSVFGPVASAGGFEALVFYNDGEPTFVESGQDHPRALVAARVATNAYEQAPWITQARYQPGVATGCCVKPLRADPLTGATTFLYTMVPRFAQQNISYHDCAEESYHVWGTSWMMQFGDIPTGGYFWRPPYINHGAFASRHGCIALGRTDGELYNHFHYNPWTTPDENAARAAAALYRRRPRVYAWVAAEGHNHAHGPPDFEQPRGA